MEEASQRDHFGITKTNKPKIYMNLFSTVLIIAIWGSCYYCHAQTADEVLKKCQYLDSQASYSAEYENLKMPTDMGHGIKLVLVQKIYGKQNDDGTKVSRVETATSVQGPVTTFDGGKPPQMPSSTIITLANGEVWKLDADSKVASQLSFFKTTSKTLKAAVQKIQGDSSILEGSENELSEEILDDYPCFKLTQVISKEGIKKQLEVWQNPAFDAVKKNASQRIIAKKVLWIRKNDYLVTKMCMYDPDGNMISGVKYKNISVGMPLPADLFVIPKGYKENTINSMAGFTESVISKVTPVKFSYSMLTENKIARTILSICFLMLTGVPVCIFIWFRKTKK